MPRSVLLVWGGDTSHGTVRIPVLLLQGTSITHRTLLRDTVFLSPCPCVPESAFPVLRPRPGPWHSEQGVRPAEGCQQYRELNLVVLSLWLEFSVCQFPLPRRGSRDITASAQMRTRCQGFIKWIVQRCSLRTCTACSQNARAGGKQERRSRGGCAPRGRGRMGGRQQRAEGLELGRS